MSVRHKALRQSRDLSGHQLFLLLAAMIIAALVGLGLPAAARAAKSSTSGSSGAGSSQVKQPVTMPAIVPGESQVSPTVIGVAKTLTLSGMAGGAGILLPAIPGVTWTSVKLRVAWPTQMASGSISVANSDRTFAMIPATTATTVLQAADVSLPEGATGEPYQVNFTGDLRYLRSYAPCGTVNDRLLNPAAYSPTIDVESVSYLVTGTNRTVGSYLQGPVQTLILRIPPAAEPETKEAMLELESHVVASDPDSSVDVRVLAGGAKTGPVGFFTRVVNFTGTGTGSGSITVGPGGMTISGAGDDAVRQVALLAQSYSNLVQTSSVATTQADGPSHQVASTMSLQQLGVTNLSASGWGDFTIGLSFSQAAAGGELQNASYMLHGTNSALANGTGGTLTLLDNGIPIQSTTLHTGQGWSMSGTVPSSSIGRSVGLTLQVQYFGSVGRCAGLPPITVAVDPDSGLTFTHGASTQTGFADLPQMLMPTVQVVLSQPGSFLQFQQAAALLAGAQRLTAVPLDVAFDDTATLPDGNVPAIVVAQSGSALNDEIEPTALTASTVQFTRGSDPTNIAIDDKVAFLTAGRRRSGAPVLAVLYPSGHPELGSQLLGLLGSRQQDWMGLTGDTAVVGANGGIATATVGAPAAITASAVAGSWLSHKWVWAFLGALAVLLLVILVSGGRRLRRSAGGPRGQD